MRSVKMKDDLQNFTVYSKKKKVNYMENIGKSNVVLTLVSGDLLNSLNFFHRQFPLGQGHKQR